MRISSVRCVNRVACYRVCPGAASAAGENPVRALGQVDFLDYCRDQPSPGEFTHVFFNGCLHNFLEPGEALVGAARLLKEVPAARLIRSEMPK